MSVSLSSLFTASLNFVAFATLNALFVSELVHWSLFCLGLPLRFGFCLSFNRIHARQRVVKIVKANRLLCHNGLIECQLQLTY